MGNQKHISIPQLITGFNPYPILSTFNHHIKYKFMNNNPTTTIEAKKDMFNGGQCFTKGQTYEVNGYVEEQYQLMERQAINDMGQPHKIGLWYKNFKIVK